MSRVRGDGTCSLFPVPRHQRKLRWWFGNNLERLELIFGTNLTHVLKGLFDSKQPGSAAFLRLGVQLAIFRSEKIPCLLTKMPASASPRW